MSLVRRLRDRSQIAIALLTALLATSCKDSNELTGKDMPVPTKAPPEGFDVDTAKRPVIAERDAGTPKARGKSVRPGLTEAEITELSKTIPKLDNALTMKALSGVPNSRVATLTVCLKLSLTQATSQLVRAYQNKSWTDLKVSTPSHDQERRTVTANTPLFRMTANVGGGGAIGCPDDGKHSKVALRFQERRSAAKAASSKLNMKLPKNGALRHERPASLRPAPGSESPPPGPRD